MAVGAVKVWRRCSSGTILRPGKLSVVSEARRGRDARSNRSGEPSFPRWSKKTGKERAAVLRKWFDLMMENQEDLARLMTLEQGKR